MQAIINGTRLSVAVVWVDNEGRATLKVAVGTDEQHSVLVFPDVVLQAGESWHLTNIHIGVPVDLSAPQ